MKIVTRHTVATALALAASLAAATGAHGAPKKGEPAPAASAAGAASPAPLPTASPEPPEIAVPRLEGKIKANPSDKEALQELAGYYLAEGKAEQALGLTKRLLSLGTKNAQVYYLDGIANQSLGRIKEATDDFENATTQEPTNAQILLTLTNLYLQTNRPTDAERVAKRATTFNPSDKRVFENYGLVLGQVGKYDNARTQFEAAAKLDPKDPLPIVLEARSYVSQKALALAGQVFDRALAIDPKFPDALLGRATVLAASHDVKGSVDAFEKLLAVEPSDEAKAAVLIQEYQVYRDEKMNDQALAVLKRAQTTYGAVPAVHIAYGDYLISIGKDQNAAEGEWKTALGPKRNNPDALQRLGELAIAQNKKNDGVGYFKRLTEVVPNDPTAWATLGQVEAQSAQYSQARDAFRHSFEIARTPQALAGLGTTDLQLRNYKECTQVFTAIDKNAPDFMKQNPQLLFVYGKCSANNGDRDQARVAYTRFKAFVKPGSPLAGEVDKAIAGLGGAPSRAKAPQAQKTAKPH
ncbi:MAG: hypothetical protein NVS3B16_21670 [Vulcanimicrobiaceae bacterium]